MQSVIGRFPLLQGVCYKEVKAYMFGFCEQMRARDVSSRRLTGGYLGEVQ